MRTLLRNKQDIFYAVYNGNVETVDVRGLYTGRREKSYSDIVREQMAVSNARTAYGFVSNVVTMDIPGLMKPYSKSIWTDDLDCPLTEESLVWIYDREVKDWSLDESYVPGELVLYNGDIYECVNATNPEEGFIPKNWKKQQHNYIVTGISKSLNYIVYAIKEVTFT